MKRYIVSTVVPGDKPNYNFIKAMETYCVENGSTEMLFIPSAPLSKKDSLHKDLINYCLFKNKKLNKNIKISLLKINPEAVDPISGLARLTQKEGSIIYASPKQRLKSIPSPRTDLPRLVLTPGAVTLPMRNDTKRSVIASVDHVSGALIVEIESQSIYHVRQVQADERGCFFDLGYKYSSTGKKQKVNVEAIIPGDYHCGFTDPKVKENIISIMKEMNPKYLFLHDFFDGISVNHHIEHKHLSKAVMGSLNDLTSELMLCANELKQICKYAKEVYIVKSNHDQFLDRWLEESKYIYDTRNHVIGLELAYAKAQGKDALEYGIKKFQTFNNVKFLKSNDSFEITDKKIECGQHGHMGPNGSRGSPASLESAYGNIVYGHSHSPEQLRGAMVVGTSTFLQLSYNIGPSSWMQTLCLVYENGSRQLINIIKGKYKA